MQFPTRTSVFWRTPCGDLLILPVHLFEFIFVKSENNGNIEAASKVGKLIAERAKEKGIEKVAFDRSGYKYHGRVKALAESAREAGLSF